jgi:hypothetical protein
MSAFFQPQSQRAGTFYLPEWNVYRILSGPGLTRHGYDIDAWRLNLPAILKAAA